MSELVEVKHSSDGGHWYQIDGAPAYTIIGKNGKERNTTLADARKLGLVPSVTEIIKLSSKPGLDNWKAEQLLMAAMTTTRQEGETEEGFIAHIKKSASEQAQKASKMGTMIHAVVQQGFEGKAISNDCCKYYNSAKQTLLDEVGYIDWECECPFGTKRYGGKIDLLSDEYLIDIKTTDKPLDGLALYDDHYMQLAAYRFGIEGREDAELECGILYVNSLTAESKLILAEGDMILRGYMMFKALLDYFYAKTGLTN